MSIKDILGDLGLKDKRADVYIACLELGSATASQIAKRAGIQRPYFYDLSEFLLQNNLITQTRKGKHRYFSAISPDKLKTNEEEKLKKLDEILPELKSIYKTTGAKPKIFFYEGKQGIEEINKDTLQYKGDIVGFSTERFLSAEEKKLSQKFIQTRIRNRIKARVIGPISNEFVDLKKKDSEELRETKMLPRDLYESDVEFTIYGNKIAIVSYKENFGFIIESSDVVKPLRMIFELIWRGGFVVN